MRIFVFFALMISFTGYCFSQGNTWIQIYDNNGIEFSYNKTECHDIQNGIHEEYFLIQITNNSGSSVNLKWNYNLWNNDLCTNCKENNSDIKIFNAKIAAGESIQGSCDNIPQKGLKVFSRFLNHKTANPVTKFTVENVEVIFE